jgi:hypothetical protein
VHDERLAQRRAICIGVASFTPAEVDDAEEPDLISFSELEYAADYAAELRKALEAAGYDAERITDPTQLSAAKLGDHVERHLAHGGIAVVHVLCHGEHRPRDGLYVVGSDGRKSQRAHPESWLNEVTNIADTSLPLFLLDLCHAGAAEQHWRPPPAGSREKAWVIAAAEAHQPAYAGRLTRAATTVINEITSGYADTAETVPFVGFDVLFERIRRQVRRLALAEGGYQQDPACIPVMGAQPELDGRPIAVTASRDDTVQLWDLTTRTQIGDPLTGHPRAVYAIACTVLNGRPAAITASRNDTLWFRDLEDRRELDRIDLPGPVRAIGVAAGNAIVVAFGWDVVVLEPILGERA